MAEQVSDAILLERFVRTEHEDAAFAALISRRRPRLQGTCRQMLRSDHDIKKTFYRRPIWSWRTRLPGSHGMNQ